MIRPAAKNAAKSYLRSGDRRKLERHALSTARKAGVAKTSKIRRNTINTCHANQKLREPKEKLLRVANQQGKELIWSPKKQRKRQVGTLVAEAERERQAEMMVAEAEITRKKIGHHTPIGPTNIAALIATRSKIKNKFFSPKTGVSHGYDKS